MNAATPLYEPLPGPDFIRLLVLYPALRLCDPVVCDIVTKPLKRSTKYAALSYLWGRKTDGDASANRWVVISGRPCGVTQNLFEALQRLRSNHRPQPVWIDAVCINQNDVEEKNVQVHMMA